CRLYSSLLSGIGTGGGAPGWNLPRSSTVPLIVVTVVVVPPAACAILNISNMMTNRPIITEIATMWCPPKKSFLRRVPHQVIHHARIGERRRVAEVGRVAFGDLAQDAAHDLAGAGLGQA